MSIDPLKINLDAKLIVMNSVKNLSVGCAPHLERVLHNPSLVIYNAVKTISEQEINFDGIACQGVSGMVFASPLALKLGKKLIVVRKSMRCHSPNMVESTLADEIMNGKCRYIFVDDLLSSGDTFNRVFKAMKNNTFLGAYFYANDEFRSVGYMKLWMKK